MLVVGDISGIHDFVTNIASKGGGQTKRLRARSFYVQALCDVAAVKILNSLGIKRFDQKVMKMAAAGHFVLEVEEKPEFGAILREQSAKMNQWLIDEFSGELRLALAWNSQGTSEMERFKVANELLNRSRLQPWRAALVDDRGWNEERLILAPLDTPCEICRQRKGEVTERDEDDESDKLVCRLCAATKSFGTELTRASWLTVTSSNASNTTKRMNAFGLAVELGTTPPAPGSPHNLAFALLGDQSMTKGPSPYEGRWLTRPMARYVPHDRTNERSTMDFASIAAHSLGDNKLGVLMADGDGMGEFWTSIIETDSTLDRYCEKSREFDDFSAREINHLLNEASKGNPAHHAKWQYIYTVYSGGDDLFFVGPWNVMLDFAGELRRLFMNRFASYGLSISAGVAICQPRVPIRQLAQVGEDLLRQAKTQLGWQSSTSKDQIATLGDVWNWRDHEGIISEGKCWANWVSQGVVERGWLRTLYELNEAQTGRRNKVINRVTTDRSTENLSSARLSYQIDRWISPYMSPRYDHNETVDSLKQRFKALGHEFESRETVQSRYLSASLQFAMMATRQKESEVDNA